MGDWYECAPYGEQVPDELQRLLAQFLTENGKPTADDEAWCIISEAAPDETWCQMFECIFKAGMKYALHAMENAVCDQDNEALKEIGLVPLMGGNFSPVNAELSRGDGTATPPTLKGN